MKLPFASLDPQEALHVAIFIEERNAELYHRFGEMFVEFRDSESLEIASVFWEMAAEERNHSSRLQEKYTERYGTSSCALTEEDLVDMIELPRLEDGDIFAATDEGGKLSARDRALRVALHAEQNAQRYYSGLAKNTEDGPLRAMYLELAAMEDDHVAFIEGKLASSSAKNQRTE
jgi:rubrerythrin